MSLLATASPWVDNSIKKRIPTIRKSTKKIDNESIQINNYNENIDGFTTYDNSKNNIIMENSDISSINKHIQDQEDKNIRVNKLLDQMTNVNVSNDGDNLCSYTPVIDKTFVKEGENIQRSMKQAVPLFHRNNIDVPFSNDLSHLANLVNYSKAYEIPNESRPFYTKKLGLSNTDSFEEKILDKIQYLTHLMEEIQSERTSNITEEFILYTMLGVFIIYVVDAFSKSGKYIR